jgi:hypothetical protein
MLMSWTVREIVRDTCWTDPIFVPFTVFNRGEGGFVPATTGKSVKHDYFRKSIFFINVVRRLGSDVLTASIR